MTEKEFMAIGSTAEYTKTFSAADVYAFAAATGDNNPVHMKESYAATTIFGRRIVHGILTAGLISTVLGTILPGTGCIYLGQDLKFKAPVYIGDTVTAKVEVIHLRTDKRIATLKTNCYNQDGTMVVDGQAVVIYPESRQ